MFRFESPMVAVLPRCHCHRRRHHHRFIFNFQFPIFFSRRISSIQFSPWRILQQTISFAIFHSFTTPPRHYLLPFVCHSAGAGLLSRVRITWKFMSKWLLLFSYRIQPSRTVCVCCRFRLNRFPTWIFQRKIEWYARQSWMHYQYARNVWMDDVWTARPLFKYSFSIFF